MCDYCLEGRQALKCDTHFNTVRAYTCRAARECSDVICTVSQLRGALIKAHKAVQTFNRDAKLPLQSCEFYLLNLNASGTYRRKQLKVADLHTVYAMRYINDELWQYTDSTYQHKVEISYEVVYDTVEYKNSIPPPQSAPSALAMGATLKRRRLNRERVFDDMEDSENSEAGLGL